MPLMQLPLPLSPPSSQQVFSVDQEGKKVLCKLVQCSQPSRADGRALAGYSPGRPGQGGYGRPGKASVFHKDGSPMG